MIYNTYLNYKYNIYLQSVKCKMEGLYLIHLREFIKSKESVFKIGRSDDIHNRVRKYPKGSNVLFTMKCFNSIECEADLIKLFNNKFIHKPEYGTEYFEGDEDIMIDEIYKYLQNYNKNYKLKVLEDLKILEDLKLLEDLKIKEELKIIEDLENDQKVENNIIEDIIKDDIENHIEDEKEDDNKTKSNILICPKCTCDYKYKSVFIKHLQTSVRCISTEEEIQEYLKKYKEDNKSKKDCNKKNKKKKKIIICNSCNSIFTKSSSLKRHLLETKCGKTKNEIENTNILVYNLIKTFTQNLDKEINNIKNQNI